MALTARTGDFLYASSAPPRRGPIRIVTTDWCAINQQKYFRDGGSGFRTGARRYAEVGRRLGAGGGVIAGDRPLALSQRKTRYPVGLAGLILGAGVGFEPTTFRL